MSYNVLSLFDGVSCGRVALEKANININKYFASEIDPHAVKIALKNYPNTIQLGNVEEITNELLDDLGKIDILIGGSPCQDLSIAKKDRKGLKGERSKLFYEYIRVLRKTNPKYFFFENVGSMTNEDKDIITEHFEVEPVVLNSNLLTAQNRVRYYWTNIEGYEVPVDKGILVADVLEEEVDPKFFLQEDYEFIPSSNKKSKTGMKFRCGIVSTKKWLDNGKNLSRNFPQGNRVYSVNGKSASLSANGGGLGAKTGLYYLEDGKPFSKNNIRRLTPVECERLQTLPDNYTEGISDTQRYKCLGNGWTVDVIAHFFKDIK
jgi:DNA-cytosine methyltransferase